MKRQKVSVVRPEESFAVEFYPSVIKFILGSNSYYVLPIEYMQSVDIKTTSRLHVYTLLVTQTGNDPQLYDQITQKGVLTELKAYFISVNKAGFQKMMIQLADPRLGDDQSWYILLLDLQEFEENLTYCLS